MKVVEVLFSGSQTRYDYLCPFDDVRVGDNAVVDTRRGEATVIVAAVKDRSDRAAVEIKRLVR